MIRKYHNHKLLTNLWQREEEPRDTRKTNKVKQSAFSSHAIWLQNYNEHKVTHNKTYYIEQITESNNVSNNQHRINNNINTALERTAAEAIGEGA